MTSENTQDLRRFGHSHRLPHKHTLSAVACPCVVCRQIFNEVRAERERIAQLAVSTAARVKGLGGALGLIGEETLLDFADLIRERP